MYSRADTRGNKVDASFQCLIVSWKKRGKERKRGYSFETIKDRMILMGKEWSLKIVKIVGVEGMTH